MSPTSAWPERAHEWGPTSGAAPDPPAWYPTTHVDLTLPQDTKVSPEVIGRLFYEISNYNLVIRNIQAETTLIPIIAEGEAKANIFALGHIADELVVPSTPFHPIAYHSRVGGRTGGVGSRLRQISEVVWTS